MKKYLSFIFIFVFMLFCCGTVFIADNFSRAQADSTIVRISNQNEFKAAFEGSHYAEKNVQFILTDDIEFMDDFNINIDCSAIFEGTFDGQGHKLSGGYRLTFNNYANTYYLGLFPQAKNATIKNLKLTGRDRTYTLQPAGINEIYIGGLVGYGENVKFENCELGEITTRMQGDEVIKETLTISAETYSNINFGAFAGKLKNDLNSEEYSIYNCVNYYDFIAYPKSNSTLRAGGLVGVLEQCKILNSISYGNINLVSSMETAPENEIATQYIGGIAGYVIGTQSKIQNTCFAGDITATEAQLEGNPQTISPKIGAIIGGVSASAPSTGNINFDYWLNDNLSSVGEGLTITSDKVDCVETINQTFLIDKTKFNPASASWDFEKIWIMNKDSNIHLQHFQSFEYSLADILDRATQVLDRSQSYFIVDGQPVADQVGYIRDGVLVKYGQTIGIKLVVKENYQKFYSLIDVVLNLNTSVPVDLGSAKQEDGSYLIEIEANNSTAGSYSFVMDADLFNCIITVSEAAKEGGQGGVKMYGATSTVQEMTLVFSIQSQSQRIVGVGSGIYTFSHWELYYQGNSGWEKVNDYEEENSALNIIFGSGLFDREFMLMAYFTDEDAVFVKFPTFNNAKIESIKISGEDYTGDSIAVSPTGTVAFEIVSKNGYALNYTKFIYDMELHYGENSVVMVGDPIKNEEDGNTTYKFNLYMKNVQNLEADEMELNFSIEDEKSSDSGLPVWGYVAIIGGGVLLIAGITILIIKKRGGGKRGGPRAVKTTQKKSSYDDYYI